MSNRRSSSKASGPDDSFIAGTLEFSAWAKANSQRLLIGGIVLVLAVATFFYLRGVRSDRENAAHNELEGITLLVEQGQYEEAKGQLNTFLDRYGATGYSTEAGMLLAQVELQEGNPEAAIAVLTDVAEGSDPLALQAATLLAYAHEAQENWAEAERVHLEVASRSRLAFQVRDARLDVARIRTLRGDSEGAAQLYRSLISELDLADPLRSELEMLLAEVTAGAPSEH